MALRLALNKTLNPMTKPPLIRSKSPRHTANADLTENNLINLMRQASLWAIIAVGQTFVIITAGIDLSVGAVVGFSGVVVAMAMKPGCRFLCQFY